ncbi:Hsp20 family protein [Vibrio owensii]|uniref:Hsp20 family protein n=1 Tax=Vibrio harveyi group TaxID=717610 RepID=UPI003CC647B5
MNLQSHARIIGLDELLARFQIQKNEKPGGYPPFNILGIGEDKYRISLAVAGFTEGEIEVTEHNNYLNIVGKKVSDETSNESDRVFIYQGIAQRNFERKFELAQYVRVKGASMENGLLHIDLQREIPEENKPLKIQIK